MTRGKWATCATALLLTAAVSSVSAETYGGATQHNMAGVADSTIDEPLPGYSAPAPAPVVVTPDPAPAVKKGCQYWRVTRKSSGELHVTSMYNPNGTDNGTGWCGIHRPEGPPPELLINM